MYFLPLTPIVPLPVKLVRPPEDVNVLVMVTFPDDADALVFPAASLNDPAATVTVPVPATVSAGVNVTVYKVLFELAKLESVPPVALRSASSKFDEASLSVIVTVPDAPAATVGDVIDDTDGRMVS
jgi:hypothetical protein